MPKHSALRTETPANSCTLLSLASASTQSSRAPDVLMFFDNFNPRLFTQLGQIECCLRHREWKRVLKVHSPIRRRIDGHAGPYPAKLCPFNPAYTSLRKCPPKTLQSPTSSYAPYLFQCLKQTDKIPRRGTSRVCFLQLSVAVVKSTNLYCR